MDKEILVYLFNGILSSNQKDQVTVINNVNESQSSQMQKVNL